MAGVKPQGSVNIWTNKMTNSLNFITEAIFLFSFIGQFLQGDL